MKHKVFQILYPGATEPTDPVLSSFILETAFLNFKTERPRLKLKEERSKLTVQREVGGAFARVARYNTSTLDGLGKVSR
jgi:hypothetical protein